MNNEFNNQNMNQFQNNNMNSQYSNNYNNQNNNKGSNNGLIAILVIIIIALVGVCLYLALDKKDNNVDNNNQQQENNNQNNQQGNENNNSQENVNNDSSTGDKVLDEYYLKTTDIIDEHILEYRYSVVANNEISYNDFREKYIVKNLIDNLEPTSNVGCGDENTVNHAKDTYDKNGVKYPNYCGSDEYCVENIAKDFGLTVDEISKMDKNVWNVGGQYCIYMYDANDVKNKYLDIYNDMFDSSFSISLSNEIFGAGHYYFYDKNLDKIISGVFGGVAAFHEQVIIDSKEENNLYKVKFVEGYFEPDFDEHGSNGKYILVIDSNNKVSNITDKKIALRENKDKLPSYEITFEKTNTGYKYKEIKKVS